MNLPLPDRAAYRQRWSALHGGYEPSGVAADWLSLVEAVARPLARRRVTPNTLTAAGVVIAATAVPAAAAGGRWPLAATAIVAFSGLADALDGSVAVLNEQTSSWGYVVDSLADRLSDLAHLAALRRAGAPLPIVQAAAAAIMTLEYSRARATAAGLSEIGVVTAGERPMRIVATALGLAGAGLLPSHARALATATAAVVLGLAGVGAGQFLRVAERELH